MIYKSSVNYHTDERNYEANRIHMIIRGTTLCSHVMIRGTKFHLFNDNNDHIEVHQKLKKLQLSW